MRWREHLVAAQQFKGSDAEYCRQHGLNRGRFKSYKQKFGMTRRYRPRIEAFVKVERAPEAETTKSNEQFRPEAYARQFAKLPDAHWLAEFVTALIARSQR